MFHQLEEQQQFELVYYDVSVQHISLKATRVFLKLVQKLFKANDSHLRKQDFLDQNLMSRRLQGLVWGGNDNGSETSSK